MANHKSSKKRILRNNKRNEINSNRISRIRTYIKKVETEIVQKIKTKQTKLLNWQCLKFKEEFQRVNT